VQKESKKASKQERKNEGKKGNYIHNINEDITDCLVHKGSKGGQVAASTVLVVWRFRRACWINIAPEARRFQKQVRNLTGKCSCIWVPPGCLKHARL
jgi:hypothetical protein